MQRIFMKRSDTLVLFDFDGTLSYRDSFLNFLCFTLPKWKIAVGGFWLSPHLTAYGLKLADNGAVKERIIRQFYRQWPIDYFQGLGHRFARERLPGLIRPDALDRLRWHQEQEHDIWVVSASLETYLLPWCQNQGVRCLATRLEYKQGTLTGKLALPNCWGPEKVNRVRQVVEPELYPYVFAYGDSRGDREMLKLADYAYYRYFD